MKILKITFALIFFFVIVSFLGSKVLTNYVYGSETPGSVDTTFSNFTSTTDWDVNAIAIQPDGKYLLGGYFATYNGVDSPGIVRINTDGSIDDSFTSPLTSQQYPFTIVIQSNGKILVGGEDGNDSFIIRLNSDGSQDTDFATSNLGYNNTVPFIALQSDGKILVPYSSMNGDFNTELSEYIPNMEGISRILIRLNTDGTLDTEFNANFDSQMSDDINFHNATVLSNDSVLLVGSSYSAEHYKDGIVKINADGTPYDGFYDEGTGLGEGGNIDDVEVDSNGKIWISGAFTEYDGVASSNVAKLNSDGTLDSSFVSFISILSNDDSYEITRLAIQPDGKVIGTGFVYGETADDYRAMVRFNADGSRDTSFDSGYGVTDNDYIVDTKLLSDNKLLVGGYFSTYNGAEYVNLVRINLGEYADTTAPTGSVSINNGATSTTNRNVTLALSAQDNSSSVSQMLICENSSFTGCSWETYSTSKAFVLSSGNGTKIVYVKYKDVNGNVSLVYNDGILLAAPATETQVIYTSSSTDESSQTEDEGTTNDSTPLAFTVEILDYAGNPVTNAHVVLESGVEGYTDNNGIVTFENVPSGNQNMTVSYGNNETFDTSFVLGTNTYTRKLTITIGEADKTATTDKGNNVNWIWYALGGVLLVGGVIYFINKKRNTAN